MSTEPEAPTEIDKLHKRIWELEVENQKLREDKEKLEAENEQLTDDYERATLKLSNMGFTVCDVLDSLNRCVNDLKEVVK